MESDWLRVHQVWLAACARQPDGPSPELLAAWDSKDRATAVRECESWIRRREEILARRFPVKADREQAWAEEVRPIVAVRTAAAEMRGGEEHRRGRNVIRARRLLRELEITVEYYLDYGHIYDDDFLANKAETSAALMARVFEEAAEYGIDLSRLPGDQK